MPNQLLLSELKSTAQEFDPILEQFIRNEINQPSLLDQTLYAISLIGERERPLLVKVASQLVGVAFGDMLPVALSAELFIAAALTGDDLLDKASTRWGKETVWQKYGESAGILVPEILHALSNTVLFRLWQLGALETVRQVIHDFHVAFRDFFIWQHLESDLEGIANVSEQECINLAYWRTGRLLQLCLTIPATLSQTSSQYTVPLSEYGRLYGTAFQLRDDLIDFIGEPELIGKPILGDLRNGQPNIVLTHFFANASSADQQIMRQWWNKKNAKPDLDIVLELCIKTGSVQHTLSLVSEYCSAAKDLLVSLPQVRERELLSQFADTISDFPIQL